jgi:hypothetical protein
MTKPSPDYIAGLKRAAEIARNRQGTLKAWAKQHLARKWRGNIEAMACGMCAGEAERIATAIEREAGD